MQALSNFIKLLF